MIRFWHIFVVTFLSSQGASHINIESKVLGHCLVPVELLSSGRSGRADPGFERSGPSEGFEQRNSHPARRRHRPGEPQLRQLFRNLPGCERAATRSRPPRQTQRDCFRQALPAK